MGISEKPKPTANITLNDKILNVSRMYAFSVVLNINYTCPWGQLATRKISSIYIRKKLNKIVSIHRTTGTNKQVKQNDRM